MFGRGKRLFSVLGFEVRIDWSWIIIAVLIAWSLSTGLFPFQYRDLPIRTYWIMGTVGAIGLFLSVIIHEFCHSLVARKYGMPVKGITLFIFGGVAEMQKEPPSPKAELFMAGVGPLSSIVIALVFYGIHLSAKGSVAAPINGVLGYLASINALLAAFNLVPAFPLDGGRMLRALLWGVRRDLRWATRVTSAMGSGFGILLIVLGVFQVLRGYFIGGMWWFLLGMFVRTAARASYQQLVIRRALEGESVQRFAKGDPVTVSPSTTLDDLVENYIYKYHHKMFPVLDDGHSLTGCVTTKQLKEVPKEQWATTTVAQVAGGCGPQNVIEPNADAIEALAKMNRNNTSRLMVADGDRLVGIIALKDLMQFLSLKVDLGE